MEKKKLKKWAESTHKTLEACRKLRKLCGKPFDRGFIGELLVLERLLKTYQSRLCASADNRFEYAGSANKEWDISLTLGKRMVYINAKATGVHDKENSPRWVRQNAKTFCDIEINPRTFRQRVGKEKKGDPNLFYVFVDVGTWIDNGTADFFTLSHKKASELFREKYFQPYNGKIRKNGSTDFWVEYKDVKQFKDPNLGRILKK